MARMFTVVFRAVAVTAVQDFFELNPASNKPIRLARIQIGQYSDFGDAQDELLSVSVFRVPATATSGSGGTSPTPQLVGATGQAAGFTAKVNNTTVATTSGTLAELCAIPPFNVRSGLDLPLEPEFRFEAVNATLLVVRLNIAPADSLTMNGTVFVVEEG